MSSALTIFIAYAPGTLSLVSDLFDPYSGIFGALFKFVVLFITGTSLINVYARKDTLANTSEHNYYSYPRIPRHHEGTDRPRGITRRIQIHAGTRTSLLGPHRSLLNRTERHAHPHGGDISDRYFPVTRQLPRQQSGGHIPTHRRPGHVHRLGHLLLEGRLPTQPKRNGPTLGMFAHCERLMPTVPSQAHHR